MAFKTLVFLGLLAVALGFTLPEEYIDSPFADSGIGYDNESPVAENLVLVRRARSPQGGRINADVNHSGRHGTQADIKYTHPLSNNFDAYVGASRNFKYNDNSGHVGFSYHF